MDKSGRSRLLWLNAGWLATAALALGACSSSSGNAGQTDSGASDGATANDTGNQMDTGGGGNDGGSDSPTSTGTLSITVDYPGSKMGFSLYIGVFAGSMTGVPSYLSQLPDMFPGQHVFTAVTPGAWYCRAYLSTGAMDHGQGPEPGDPIAADLMPVTVTAGQTTTVTLTLHDTSSDAGSDAAGDAQSGGDAELGDASTD
jgi:hypothetical protein